VRPGPERLARFGGLGLRAGVVRDLGGPGAFLQHRGLDRLLLRLGGREVILDLALRGRFQADARGERVADRFLDQLLLGLGPDFGGAAGGTSAVLPELPGLQGDIGRTQNTRRRDS